MASTLSSSEKPGEDLELLREKFKKLQREIRALSRNINLLNLPLLDASPSNPKLKHGIKYIASLRNERNALIKKKQFLKVTKKDLVDQILSLSGGRVSVLEHRTILNHLQIFGAKAFHQCIKPIPEISRHIIATSCRNNSAANYCIVSALIEKINNPSSHADNCANELYKLLYGTSHRSIWCSFELLQLVALTIALFKDGTFQETKEFDAAFTSFAIGVTPELTNQCRFSCVFCRELFDCACELEHPGRTLTEEEDCDAFWNCTLQKMALITNCRNYTNPPSVSVSVCLYVFSWLVRYDAISVVRKHLACLTTIANSNNLQLRRSVSLMLTFAKSSEMREILIEALVLSNGSRLTSGLIYAILASRWMQICLRKDRQLFKERVLYFFRYTEEDISSVKNYVATLFAKSETTENSNESYSLYVNRALPQLHLCVKFMIFEMDAAPSEELLNLFFETLVLGISGASISILFIIESNASPEFCDLVQALVNLLPKEKQQSIARKALENLKTLSNLNIPAKLLKSILSAEHANDERKEFFQICSLRENWVLFRVLPDQNNEVLNTLILPLFDVLSYQDKQMALSNVAAAGEIWCLDDGRIAQLFIKKWESTEDWPPSYRKKIHILKLVLNCFLKLGLPKAIAKQIISFVSDDVIKLKKLI